MSQEEHLSGLLQDAVKYFQEMDTKSLLEWFLAALASKAWQAMGVMLAPGAAELKQDPDQARLAIDAFAALLPVLEPGLGGAEVRRLRGLLADLRVNFVSRCGGAETP